MTAIQVLQQNYPGYDWRLIDRKLAALRTRAEKLIVRQGLDAELYDLGADPGERNNVGEANAGRRDELGTLLGSALERMASGELHPLLESHDEESLQQLRALGYIK